MGRWSTRSRTRAGRVAEPSRRSSADATFGPTPRSLVASTNSGLRSAGRIRADLRDAATKIEDRHGSAVLRRVGSFPPRPSRSSAQTSNRQRERHARSRRAMTHIASHIVAGPPCDWCLRVLPPIYPSVAQGRDEQARTADDERRRRGRGAPPQDQVSRLAPGYPRDGPHHGPLRRREAGDARPGLARQLRGAHGAAGSRPLQMGFGRDSAAGRRRCRLSGPNSRFSCQNG